MRNETVFLDTSGWIALLNTDDRSHPTAVQIWREIIRQNKSIFLTHWIIAETGNGLARTSRRD